MTPRSWVEIAADALHHNVRALRACIGPDRIFCAVVKANAYGHGLSIVAPLLARDRAFLGRDGQRGWFGVDSLPEAHALRALDITLPILILGYVPLADARLAVRAEVQPVIAAIDSARAFAVAARGLRRRVRVHVKVETGTQRQGIPPEELPAFLRACANLPALEIVGCATHLADVEDTGPDGFAALQLERFFSAHRAAERIIGHPLLRHVAASAASLLLPDARMDLARFGIAMYGLWPSARTEAAITHRDRRVLLRPVLAWKTIVGPMHDVPRGAPVGYGCMERMRRRTRVAVLPIGYWDGYDRRSSRVAHVLVRGRRCNVLGRVCMNMIIVDVTDVPRLRIEEEVVVIGTQGRAAVTADELADHRGTINYEVVTRISPLIPRTRV